MVSPWQTQEHHQKKSTNFFSSISFCSICICAKCEPISQPPTTTDATHTHTRRQQISLRPPNECSGIYTVNYVLKIYLSSSHKVCRNSFKHIFPLSLSPVCFALLLLDSSLAIGFVRIRTSDVSALRECMNMIALHIPTLDNFLTRKIQAKRSTHTHTHASLFSLSLLRMLRAKTCRVKNGALEKWSRKKLSRSSHSGAWKHINYVENLLDRTTSVRFKFIRLLGGCWLEHTCTQTHITLSGRRFYFSCALGPALNRCPFKWSFIAVKIRWNSLITRARTQPQPDRKTRQMRKFYSLDSRLSEVSVSQQSDGTFIVSPEAQIRFSSFSQFSEIVR